MNTTEPEITEKITRLLDEGVNTLDGGTQAHLYDIRRQAMNAHPTRHAAQHTGYGILVLRQHPWLRTWGVLAASLMAAFWLWYPHPSTDLPADTGDLDIELLTGEVPPQVFADWGLVTRENVEATCLPES